MSSVSWTFASPPDEALAEVAEGLPEQALPTDAEVIKHSRARTVWRAPDTAGGLLIKHYRVRGLESLKARIQPGRAEREYRVMEAFCGLDVPTVRPLAYADRREGGRLLESWFIGRLLPRARHLAEALTDEPDDARAVELLDAALAVVTRMNAEPFLHRDLHAGNLLIGDDNQPRIIDLHSVWRVPLLTRRMCLGMLGRLFHSVRHRLDLDELPGWLEADASRRGEPLDRWVRDVRQAVVTFQADHVRGRSARCLRETSEYTKGRVSEGRLWRRKEYELEALRADLVDHDAVLAADDARVLGRARRSTVSLTADGQRVVKRYLDRGAAVRCRARLGFGRSRVAWMFARRCRVVGVPTPQGLALLEHADGSATLVTRVVPEGRGLLEWNALDLDRQTSDRLAFALGHVVGRLARSGLRHNDMSPKNVVVGGTAPEPVVDVRMQPRPGDPDVQLIDLDGMSRMTPHQPAAVAHMLGQLADLPRDPTARERRVFALGYARAAGRSLTPDVIAVAERRLAARRARREAATRRSG
jgi:tRNA A-37 threonylcarbamoyl transferase component Bud32